MKSNDGGQSFFSCLKQINPRNRFATQQIVHLLQPNFLIRTKGRDLLKPDPRLGRHGFSFFVVTLQVNFLVWIEISPDTYQDGFNLDLGAVIQTYHVSGSGKAVEHLLYGIVLGVLRFDFQIGRLSDTQFCRLGMPHIDIFVIHMNWLLDGRGLRLLLLLAHRFGFLGLLIVGLLSFIGGFLLSGR